MDCSGAYSFLVWASSMNSTRKYVLIFKIYDTNRKFRKTNSMLINLPTLGNRDFIIIFSLLISSFQCCNREQATQSQYF